MFVYGPAATDSLTYGTSYCRSSKEMCSLSCVLAGEFSQMNFLPLPSAAAAGESTENTFIATASHDDDDVMAGRMGDNSGGWLHEEASVTQQID
jgi:hypothetical protein